MDNSPYLLALHSIDGLGPIRLKAILDYFKDPKLAWEAKENEFITIGIPKPTVELLDNTRKSLDPLNYAKAIQEMQIKWMSVFDKNYPPQLKQIYDPPIVLYYKGEILPQDENAIAIVGTRKMTGYGKAVTKEFTQQLVEAGFTVVSGLARGVDSEAHQVSLEKGGRTLAILGGGLNQIYPPENQNLAQKISQGFGAVISEFPPNYPSMPGNFPSRNRIIAGLSKAILVTEAAEDSGSLITARLGLEQGKDIYAVPGPVTSSLSKGPIDLIKEGAKPTFSPKDILDEMGIKLNQNSKFKNQNLASLSENEKKVLEALENESKHMDEICRQLNFSASLVSATLLKMEIQGLVTNLGGGNYAKS